MRVALIQMACVYDKAANVSKAADYIRQAADAGAELVCLQEFFNTTYFPLEIDVRHFDLAEPIPGPSTEPLMELAKERRLVIVASLYERVFSGEYFNTSAVI